MMQILTLVGFFGIVVGVIIWAIFASKRYVNHMSELTLEDENSIKGEYELWQKLKKNDY